MELSEFQKEYHWFHGLREYFSRTEHADQFEVIFKAFFHSNWYRKREVIAKLATHKKLTESQFKVYLNSILHEQLPDIELRQNGMMDLLREYMDNNEFLESGLRFLNYFEGEDHTELGPVEMPDMNDFLSKGQVQSKVWLIDELKKFNGGNFNEGAIVFYGGWYNFIAHMMYKLCSFKKVYSLDLNGKVIEPSKRLYHNQLESKTFQPIKADVNKIEWTGADSFKYLKGNEKLLGPAAWAAIENVALVINTSCEHMDETWFNNLPAGTLVALQTNDYFDNDQHINCVHSVGDAIKKYPMTDVIYSGELDTYLYKRFMLIGIK